MLGKVGILLTTLLMAGIFANIQRPPQQVVAEVRAQFGDLSDPATVVVFLRRLAAALNTEGVPGGPFGILVKTGGNNCQGYSCDIICAGNGSTQKQWDVLVGTPGSPGSWRAVDGPTVRPCEIGTTPPPPPPCGWPDQREEVAQLRVTLVTAERERDEARTERDAARTERDVAQAHVGVLERDRERLTSLVADYRERVTLVFATEPADDLKAQLTLFGVAWRVGDAPPGARCKWDWAKFSCRLVQ